MTRSRALGRGLGIRARTTLITAVTVGLVLSIAGALLVVATRSALLRSVETSASARAVDLASQVTGRGIPRSVPLIAGIPVQVVVDGLVVSSTADIEGQGPIMAEAANPGTLSLTRVPALDWADAGGAMAGDSDEGGYVVATTAVVVDGRVVTVLAAAPLGSVDGAVRALVPLLVLGIPTITVLFGLIVWRLVRRAFRPVEAMAQQADGISYRDLHLRIPEPHPDDEIRHLSVVLNRMLERLESSAMRQRSFTADAGHELKSPVTTLLAMAEVAEANPGKFSVAELAADVAGQSRRLVALVDDLLVLARSDEHRLEPAREEFDLADVILDEVAVARPTRVAIDTAAVRSVQVMGDRRRIGQAVRNLLDNARRHASGVVRVDTELDHGVVVIRVADDGSGIAVGDRERVFDRFVRLDDSRSRDVGGTGLGLSVVRSIVAAHGGRVTIGKDAELGGALVTIEFPQDDGLGALSVE